MHMRYSNISRAPLVIESGEYFIQHVAWIREQRLIEHSIWSSEYSNPWNQITVLNIYLLSWHTFTSIEKCAIFFELLDVSYNTMLPSQNFLLHHRTGQYSLSILVHSLWGLGHELIAQNSSYRRWKYLITWILMPFGNNCTHNRHKSMWLPEQITIQNLN